MGLFAVIIRDQLWSNLGIICGFGILCGRGSFTAMYNTHTTLHQPTIIPRWNLVTFCESVAIILRRVRLYLPSIST